MFVPLWLLPTSSERQEAPGHEPKRIFLAYKYKATCVYNIYIYISYCWSAAAHCNAFNMSPTSNIAQFRELESIFTNVTDLIIPSKRDLRWSPLHAVKPEARPSAAGACQHTGSLALARQAQQLYHIDIH